MQINLNQKISEHLQRLEDLAREAEDDEEQSFSSRASAMSALTGMFKELVKSQAEVVNMERMMRIERITIETVKKYLTLEQSEVFLQDLENILNDQL